jgi:hypothetical protein
MRCNGCKQLLQLGLRLVVDFGTLGWIRTEKWLHSSRMVHQELVSQQNTSLIGHISRPWNGSAAPDERWGFMAAHNCLSLGSDWLDVSDSLTRSGQKSDFIHHRWSTSRSWFHSKTSLIGCISRPWNGSAAPDEVLWLQTTASVWAQIGCRFRNF